MLDFATTSSLRSLLAIALFASAPAYALDPTAPPKRVDTDPFTPSSSLAIGLGTLQGEAPTLGTEGLSFALDTSVARNLAVFRYTRGGETPIVGQVLVTEVDAGWTIGDRARIDLAIPFYPYAEARWNDYLGAAMGDIRVQATVPLVGATGDSFALAVLPRLGLPTGTASAYLARGLHGGVTAAAGGEVGKLNWIGNAGFTFSGTDQLEGITVGSTLDLLGGASFAVQEGFRVGADLSMNAGLANGRTGVGNTHAEGALFAQTRLQNGMGMTVGAGTGLIGGVGAPDWRLFAALSYGSSVRDQDGDGLLDPVDACPIDAEDFDQFEDTDGCPEADNDKDGYVDASDACPLVAEDDDNFENDGCPELDNDLDTVVDTEDLCPLVPGPVEFQGCPDTDKDGLADSEDQCPEDPGPKELFGCPDRDADLVPDYRDQCPDQKKPVDEDPATSDGCPKRVIVTATAFVISEKVFFETGKSTIKPESFSLLDDVAKAAEKAVWVTKIEVGGHTDDKGSDESNLKLSQARAQSVADYLVTKGVAKDRIVAKGYGETTFIDTNRTDAGRANNRRVEFHILEQDPSKIPAPKAPPNRPTGLQPKAPGTTPATTPTTPGTTPTTITPTTPTTPATTPATTPTTTTPATTPTTVAPAATTPGTTTPATTTPATATPATTTPVTPAATGPAAAPGTPGSLAVNLVGLGWADVYIDDVKVPRTAPFKGVVIAPGKHDIVVVNNRSGFNYEQWVDVAAGQAIVLDVGKPAAAPTPGTTTPATTPATTPPVAPAPTKPPTPTPDNPWGAPQ